MTEYTPIEQVVEIHELDEVGRGVNDVLADGGQLCETLEGYSLSRNVRTGDVSLFFSRIDSPNHRKFIVGIDLIDNKEEELVPLRTFEWNIYDPAGAQLTEGDIKRLKIVVDVASRIGSLNDQA